MTAPQSNPPAVSRRCPPVPARILLKRIILMLMVAALAAVPVSEAAPGLRLEGQVRDPLGRALQGVQVLVLPADGPPIALGEARTSLEGRFAIAGLAPGRYKLAALKAGYETSLQKLTLLARATAHVVLNPLPEAGETDRPLPEDARWSLRLPRRHILRDETPDLARLGERATGGGGQLRERLDAMLQGAVGFSMDLPGLGTDSGGAGLTGGHDVALELASMLPNGAWARLTGERRRSEGSLDSLGAAAGHQNRIEASLRIPLPVSGDVRVDAFARDAGSRLSPGLEPFSATAPLERRLDAKGLHADWSHQLRSTTRLEVALDHHQQDFVERAGAAGVEASRAGTRRTRASGVVDQLFAGGHHLALAVRAERFKGAAPSQALGDSWNLSVRATDAWRPGGAWTMLYGVTYEDRIGEHGPGLLLPEAGVALDHRAVGLRLSVQRAWLQDGGMNVDAPPWGYAGHLEVPLGAGVSLTADASRRPALRLDGVDPALPMGNAGLLALDGHGWVTAEDAAVGIERRWGAMHGRIGWAEGERRGVLVVFPWTAGAVRAPVTTEALAFRSGELSLAWTDTGTRIAATWFEWNPDGAPGSAGPTAQLEVRFTQVVGAPVDGGPSPWRVVLLVRDVRSDADSDPGTAGENTDPLLALLDRQIRAGVVFNF